MLKISKAEGSLQNENEKSKGASSIDESIINDLNDLKIYDDKQISILKNRVGEILRKELLVYQKPNNSFSLFDIEQNILRNFNFNEFIIQESIFQPSDILPKTSFTDQFLNSNNQSMLFMLTLIRDICYQLYKHLVKPYERQRELAKHLIQNNVNIFPGYDATLDQAWAAIINHLSMHIKTFMEYTKQLPGFDKMDLEDLGAILKENLSFMGSLRVHYLHINDECYFMYDDIQFSRKWLEKLVGEKACDRTLEFHKKLSILKLTDQEMGLFFPFILTSPCIL